MAILFDNRLEAIDNYVYDKLFYFIYSLYGLYALFIKRRVSILWNHNDVHDRNHLQV